MYKKRNRTNNEQYVSADSVDSDATNSCPEIIYINDIHSHVQEKRDCMMKEAENISFKSNKEEYFIIHFVTFDTSVTNSCPEITRIKDICFHKRNRACKFDGNEKFDILTISWVPNEKVSFPSHQFGCQNRKF